MLLEFLRRDPGSQPKLFRSACASEIHSIKLPETLYTCVTTNVPAQQTFSGSSILSPEVDAIRAYMQLVQVHDCRLSIETL